MSHRTAVNRLDAGKAPTRATKEMQPRLDPYQAAPEIMQAMKQLEERVRNSGLEPSLIQLVKTRASQLNGCGYCLHMHTAHARAAGETETRLYLLSAWRESPLFSPRERAALAWTEALTLLPRSGAPDRDYDALSEQFSEAERVKLSMLIVAINGWNRIAVGFRLVHPIPPDRAAA
jgi:AhpD family alkylhydroperoxidase